MIKSLVFAGRVSCCNCRALHITGPELAILKMKKTWNYEADRQRVPEISVLCNHKDEGVSGPQMVSCKTQTSPKIDELGESITSKAKHQQATQRAKGVSLLY